MKEYQLTKFPVMVEEGTEEFNLEFRVEGSVPEPYTVNIVRKGTRVHATCDCEAGTYGVLCKHRLRIFRGNSEDVVSDMLKKWLLFLTDYTVQSW